MISLPPVHPDVKHVAHFLKVADEHDERNIVVSYWCRMYACQAAMKAVPGKKPPEVTALLVAIMDWLEQTKKAHSESDGITNDTAAQALIEEYAIQLFQYADGQDQIENFGKNVVKAFYTAGILMDVLQQFGILSDDIFHKRKYAKWKAAYIHNCLKIGEKPVPGPPIEGNLLPDSEDDEDEERPIEPLPPSDEPVGHEFGNPSVPPSQPFSPFDLPSVPAEPDPYASRPIVPQPTPQPVPQPAPRIIPATPSTTTADLGPEQIEKAQKYCKWAGSALNYDDVATAVDNLQRALYLLQNGEEMK